MGNIMVKIVCNIGNINVSNKPPNVVKTALKSINSGSYLLRYKLLNRWLFRWPRNPRLGLCENRKLSSIWETKITFLETNRKRDWNDFEWIWMVRNEPCLNIFVTKTQQIRFNPTQGTKPAGSSWIFINVPDLG